MPIILYQDRGGNSVDRYNYLKNMMIKDSYLSGLQKKRNEQLKNFFNIFNSKIKYIKNFEEKVLEVSRQCLNKNLSQSLEDSVANASAILDKVKSNQALNSALTAYGNAIAFLNGIIVNSRGGKGARISSSALQKEINNVQLNSLLQKINDKTFVEIGNITGSLGVLGAFAQLQGATENILNEFVDNNIIKNGLNVVLQDTGAKKKTKTNRTVVTDGIMAAVDANNAVLSVLPVSIKMNTLFTKHSTSTIKPVKMASRTIANFVKDVSSYDNRVAKAYEKTLYNYISYHDVSALNTHFMRQDYIADFQNDWKELRRAVSAELLYQLTSGRGAGSFNVGGQEITDAIQLYFYGDKIFVNEDLIKSAFFSKSGSSRNINMATIGDKNVRKKILINPDEPQSFLTPALQKVYNNRGSTAATEWVETQISKVAITYSQVIRF